MDEKAQSIPIYQKRIKADETFSAKIYAEYIYTSFGFATTAAVLRPVGGGPIKIVDMRNPDLFSDWIAEICIAVNACNLISDHGWPEKISAERWFFPSEIDT